jgi:hypothetical protein
MVDQRAIGHILAHYTDYPKPGEVRRALSQMLGDGVLMIMIMYLRLDLHATYKVY